MVHFTLDICRAGLKELKEDVKDECARSLSIKARSQYGKMLQILEEAHIRLDELELEIDCGSEAANNIMASLSLEK